MLFDLTVLREQDPVEPTVIYLVPAETPRSRPMSWRGWAGIATVIAAGSGLGIILAAIILP